MEHFFIISLTYMVTKLSLVTQHKVFFQYRNMVAAILSIVWNTKYLQDKYKDRWNLL